MRSVSRQSVSWLPWLLAVLGASLLLRLFFLAFTPPVVTDDSPGYILIAQHFPDVGVVDGTRTPIYPALIALVGINPAHVRLAQMAIGLVITAGLFLIVWRLTHRGDLAALGAAFYGLSLVALRYESDVLTETLATFLLVAEVVVLQSIFRDERRPWWKFAALGVVAALAAVERPAEAFLPFVVLVALAIAERRRANVLVFAIAGILPVLVWCGMNQARFGMFGVSTLTGYDLTDLSGQFIEDAPPQYAYIRDAYLAAARANGGDRIFVIYLIEKDVRASTGQSAAQFSQTLARMSVTMFVQHPGLYLHYAAISLAQFWLTRGFSEFATSLGRPGDFLVNRLGDLEKVVVVVTNAAFILVSVAALVFSRLKHGPVLDVVPATVAGMVWAAAVSQAFVEFGDASRYSVPFVGLIALVVIAGVPQLWPSISEMTWAKRAAPGARAPESVAIGEARRES